MAILTVDLTALPLNARRTFDAVMKSETAAEIVRAKARQRRIAQWFHNNRPRAIEGLGGQIMAIDPFIWSALRRVCKAVPGEDQEVQNWAARKYPELRVRHQPTRVQVGYGSTSERNLKFSKTYVTSSGR
jgi:hypothetical protein